MLTQTLAPLQLDALLDLARRAGAAILAHYQVDATGALQVDHKSDGSPLTQADLAAHRLIVAQLQADWPAWPVVSEEDETAAPRDVRSGTFWLVDPLDGTKEFVHRNGEFTVNIALVCERAPVFGVVYAPALDLLYWGGEGLGAWCEVAGVRRPIAVAAPPAAGAPWRVVASKSHLDDTTRDFIAALGAHVLVGCGSSLKFCRVAEGAADLYPRFAPTHEWDTAAAHAIVLAAGGQVCTPDGVPLQYGTPGVLNPSFVVGAPAALQQLLA